MRISEYENIVGYYREHRKDSLSQLDSKLESCETSQEDWDRELYNVLLTLYISKIKLRSS